MTRRGVEKFTVEEILARCALIGRNAAEACVLADPPPWDEGHVDFLSGQLVAEAYKEFRKYRKDVADRALSAIFDNFHTRMTEIIVHMPVGALSNIDDAGSD